MALGGYAVTSEAKSVDKNNIDLNEIKKMSSAMGLTSDVHDMIEAFQECKKTLEKKAIQLNILEALAMESNDENISELREQMFAVTKLLYSDIIEEIMNENNPSEDDEYNGYAKSDPHIITKQNILHRMRTYMVKRSKYKEKLKIIKKRLKKNMELL